MKKIGFIPLRAGSKGIPNKNKKRILGRPLFTWILSEAIQSSLDEIYIFTDDNWIIDFVHSEFSWTNKVFAIERSSGNASDTSSTEDAMIEFSEKLKYNFDIIVLLQATSPLTTKEYIDKACESIIEKKADSTISVIRTHRFIWSEKGESINYNYKNRPRRQDFNGLLIENGAIYACTKEIIKKEQNRLGGKIELIEMPEDTLIEIDEPTDLLIIEKLIENRLSKNKKNEKIKYLFLDVDGVFTNGKVAISKNEEFSKEFSLVDGMGIQLLQEDNIIPVVITSENSPIVKTRMEKLKIENTFLGIKDKFSFIEDFLIRNNAERKQTAYIGDDINDLANICASGLSFCPQNAIREIKSHSDVILNNSGSNGAIRETCEYIINYNKRF